MLPDNQASTGGAPHDPPREAAPGAAPAGSAAPPEAFSGALHWSPETGLLVWFAILVVFGIGGLLLGQQELAALVALAGLFVAAQAADIDRRWRGLYHALAWIVPVGGAATFAAAAILVAQSDLSGLARWTVLALSVASGLTCLATQLPPVAEPLTRFLLRTNATSHSLSLATRLIVAGLLLAVPGWFAFRGAIEDLLQSSAQFMEQLPMGGGLLGYVLLALAAVGFLVRRDLPSTLERPGLKPFGVSELAIVGLGVGAIFALNLGADALQHRLFPELWRSDQQFNQALAGGLKPAQVVVLSLSAGIGEEITLRGALQPRLGLTLTSLLFAALHVQYSWFGMVVIFALGLVLGIIRQRTSTTVAMAVHVLFDVLAVVTTSR